MKRRLLPLALIPLLTIVGCSTSAENGPQYSDVSEAIVDAGKAPLGWECEQREHPLVGDSAADCHSDGGSAFIAVFSTDADKDTHVQKVRDTPAWHADVPAMVVGATWVLQCSQAADCEAFSQRYGGRFVTSPGYGV